MTTNYTSMVNASDLLLQLKQICTMINICLTLLYDATSILGGNLGMHDNQPHARKPEYCNHQR